MAWRDDLRPNSFRGVPFNVEEGTQAGGRRNATFEFPKRDDAYVESMGRRVRRFSVSGYVVGPDYTFQREALIAALEADGAGTLVHQTLGRKQVKPETYSTRESNRRGGVCDFDMTFVEVGASATAGVTQATQSNVREQATVTKDQAVTTLDNAPVSV